ncbi:DNA-processing protein DprA [Staphylococcus caeli]|uniref:DprA SMF protein DNA processing factor n=1 Tax=Staphylococcus caeli TaxID=2201815 RepID=A0A1D4MZX6_9STAP|nr:DNA-processing protein DprA [Staphylococcus caeli]SCT03909.1 DprA SMF protein DNA processing factor [Staphylococcus caeli]SCT11264.1 DprA SMF protein DNA processing factor [Staphylococcus caeli]
MNDKHYLRLRFSGLSTTQIYQLLNFAPTFMLANELEQRSILQQFLTTLKSKNKENIYQLFEKFDLVQLQQQLQAWHINYITIDQHTYPPLLREIHNPPFILFYRGNLNVIKSPQTLAIIGSRKATDYTWHTLQQFFPSFKKHNLTIVSGLAYGADKMAHQFALFYKMPTIAVLGFGHLNHYPQSTQNVRNKIEATGIVISEYIPNAKPYKYHFPERNRIISGLSRGVFITEATEKSGTCITTNCALEQNREVYVLPGPIFNKMTEGNLRSAQEGAKIIRSVEDILEDYI